MQPTRLILFAALALLWPATTAADPPVKVLGRAEGLPSNQVQALALDRQGVLWFATPSGLARYDGARVIVYSRNEGLSTPGLRTITLLPDGRLAIGSDIGIDIVEPDGTLHPLVDPVAWRFGFVDHIAPDFSGRVWLGTAEGLVQWSPDGAVVQVADSAVRGKLVEEVMVDRADNVWIAGPQLGLMVRRSGRWEDLPPENWADVGRILSLAETPDGSILIGGERGLAVIPPREVPWLPSTRGVPRQPISAMLPTDTGVWMGIGGRLVLYRSRGDRWVEESSLSSNSIVHQIQADGYGNVWVATDNRGALKVSALRSAIADIELPCPGGVFAIRETPASGLLVGGDNCSARLDLAAGRADRIAALDGRKVWDLTVDRRGALWVATERGLSRVGRDGDLLPVGRRDPILAAPSRVILERDDGLWVGTRLGLAVVRQGRITSITDAAGRSPGYVYTLLEDAAKNLWVGTIGAGLWRERNGALQSVRAAGLPETGNVYAIAEGNDGMLAVVIDDRIILLSPGGLSRPLAVSEEPIAGWSAAFAGTDRLWVGGTSGLVEYDIATGDEVRRVTPSMGLAGREFTTSRSLLVGRDGRLLAGLNEGLSVVDPRALDVFRIPPEVKPGRIQWLNASPDSTDGLVVVRSGRWTLDVEWFSAWFIDEENLRYRHRLAGFDPDWSPPSAQSSLQYLALPAGDYRLEVEAYSPLLGWGPASTILELRVKPPWWATTYARAFYFLIGAGAILLLVRWRNRQLVRRTQELEQRVRERTHDLEHANEQLVALNQQLDSISRRDALTGLANRRQFDEVLAHEFQRADRTDTPTAMLVLDIDHFKAYNDSYGHPSGDACLVAIARVLEVSIRDGGDLVARLGGEEFAVLLPNAGKETAQVVAERLREGVAALPTVHDDQSAVLQRPITVSVGFAVAELARDMTPETLLHEADQALYRAKAEGRNRVVYAS
jgi:diguanylate cyclase (GGDEF)-like protein